MLELKMPQGTKINHDPMGLILKHCSMVGIQWSYSDQVIQE